MKYENAIELFKVPKYHQCTLAKRVSFWVRLRSTVQHAVYLDVVCYYYIFFQFMILKPHFYQVLPSCANTGNTKDPHFQTFVAINIICDIFLIPLIRMFVPPIKLSQASRVKKMWYMIYLYGISRYQSINQGYGSVHTLMVFQFHFLVDISTQTSLEIRNAK